MKKLILLPILAMTVILAGPAQAGETTTSYKNVAPAPAPEYYGTGFYGGIILGGNIFQDEGGDRVVTNGFGDAVRIEPKNDAGFFGGIKLGYVFGTGSIRFALEEDMFYNGWKSGADFTLLQDGVIRQTSTDRTINTGAFMTNGLIRFNGLGKFQPYIGGGIGVYYASSAGTTVGRFDFDRGASHTDFAWQLIAGADYYFNYKTSIFIEYKYLEYTASQADFGNANDRSLGQQLLGAGFRFHF